ncbi:MAG TPA: hypothetical protein VIK91_07695 [Nannocystis sp.]
MFDNDHWLSDLLLGYAGRQRHDIERLKTQATIAQQRLQHDADTLAALRARVDRLELVCEALLHLVLKHNLIDPQGLAHLMVQIDLRDGREDGRVSGDEPPIGTPLCSTCDLPVNPRREACVYCGAPIKKPEPRPQRTPRPPRTVMCVRCHKQVDVQRTMITGSGVCCDACATDV